VVIPELGQSLGYFFWKKPVMAAIDLANYIAQGPVGTVLDALRVTIA